MPLGIEVVFFPDLGELEGKLIPELLSIYCL